jgi:hypothetical protein
MKSPEFLRGARLAADIAETFNASSSHLYRLGDCILAKLNIRREKPRRNPRALRSERDAWLTGFATALTEMHRRLINSGPSTDVCVVARAAGLTLKSARAAGVSPYRLKRAGVR